MNHESSATGATGPGPGIRDVLLLGVAPPSDAASTLAEEDVDDLGFVTTVTKVWMHDPAASDELFALLTTTAEAAGLSTVDRGVATVVAANLIGDSYCPLAYARKLAEVASPEFAASLLRGSDELLDERGRAIAAWARIIAQSPRSATAADLEALLRVGFDRAQILRLTLFITLRIAFATLNGALGARPEAAYVDLLDPIVREAWKVASGTPDLQLQGASASDRPDQERDGANGDPG